MAPRTLVRRHGCWRIRAAARRVVVRPFTPLHEQERLSSLSTPRVSPRLLRCRWLSGGLRWLVVQPPASGNSWLSLTSEVLPIAAAYEWAVLPNCGAVVLFSGTVRDHAVDEHGVLRDHVASLTYEAYESQVVPRLSAIDVELRQRWPQTGRVVLIHRTGELALGESSVIAVVSAPHRGEAFEAARFAIDALKLSVPIWKREVWRDGADWGVAAGAPIDAASVPAAAGRRTPS
jgi:molybdopterin synthase catalytic subunit